jgi:hypothetical protein
VAEELHSIGGRLAIPTWNRSTIPFHCMTTGTAQKQSTIQNSRAFQHDV